MNLFAVSEMYQATYLPVRYMVLDGVGNCALLLYGENVLSFSIRNIHVYWLLCFNLGGIGYLILEVDIIPNSQFGLGGTVIIIIVFERLRLNEMKNL